MTVEQILLQRPSIALLSQKPLGLTVVLFKLGGGHITHACNNYMYTKQQLDKLATDKMLYNDYYSITYCTTYIMLCEMI